ncbi:hypothetical protein GDO86_009158 [Hymenochirus boettgeri]|uniref:Uncharacterized protein n=1 Tax=Hymenochirus boettgeri TaxID=247094 RepID=A0A8T2JFD0_9PIPI|nr:hypothetical protein GDO86_009158 [Hymenochirus boettgeri]
MSYNQNSCQTSDTVRIHGNSGSKMQRKKKIQHKRPVVKENKKISERNLYDNNTAKQFKGPCIIIQRIEMTVFFKLFVDDLIQDFLWMSCCK